MQVLLPLELFITCFTTLSKCVLCGTSIWWKH